MKHVAVTKFNDSLLVIKTTFEGIIASLNAIVLILVPSNKRLMSCRTLSKILPILCLSVLLGCSLQDDASTSGDDPVTVNNAVAFIKRPLLVEDERIEDDLTEPASFRPGAVLYIKESASPSVASRDITSIIFSDPAYLNDDGVLLYDVKDLNVSYDGNKLIFSMRAPEIENADEEDQPKWNIWEYNKETEELRRVIESSITSEDGHDISPSYLPDGRILFTSTRQRRAKAILTDEGKDQFSALDEDRSVEAFTLHVMSDQGLDIKQLTYNQSHDLNPTVLDNGKILFSRWDNAGQTRNNGLNLYQINPDGTGLTYLYGRHSHDSGAQGDQVQYFKPRQIDNGNIVVQLREFLSDNFSSQPVEININDFSENDVAIDGAVGEGQSALISGLNSSGDTSLKGSYGAFFPLYDGTNRYLVSWSQCRIRLTDSDAVTTGDQLGELEFCTSEKLSSGDYTEADPFYGLWVLDADAETQLPIENAEEGQLFDDVVLMKSRPEPDSIPALELVGDVNVLAEAGLGVIHIRSVYDFDGQDTSASGLAALADPLQTAPSDRPQRFVRIEKAVSIPSDEVRDFDNSAFGRSRAQSMREVLGYTPVEPDGSVKVAVPANVAFAISILDENGRRTSERHQNWLQVAPGETVECIGCHTSASDVPHGRFDAEPESSNSGAVTTGVPFPNTEAALFADMGETMAETYARVMLSGEDIKVRKLSPDIIYDDEWTDATITPKADSFSYAYSDLQTNKPAIGTCLTNWTSLCRITINYEEHIHPLWSVDRDRRVFDTDGVTLLEGEDQTCTSCHSNVDESDAARIPAEQLDLTNGVSDQEPDHYKSYRELLFNDNQVEVVNGALIDFLQDTGEVEMVADVDENGDPVLDGEGNPVLVPRLVPSLDDNGDPEFDGNGEPILVTVPIRVTVNVAPTINVAGASNSADFWAPFLTGQSHDGYLSGAESKLISEWMDLGAQYFNDPFAAPAN